MTVYILDNEPAAIAQCLDDKSLYCIIKDIAQVLCNVHHDLINDKFFESSKYSTHCMRTRDKWKLEIPLEEIYVSKTGLLQWSKWASECKANYNYLVKLSMHCCVELMLHREILKCKKYQLAIDWASTNLPDLPSTKDYEKNMNYKEYRTPFPLVMPKKYLINYADQYPEYIENVVASYHNYYQDKLKQYIEKSVKKLQGESFQGAKTEVNYDGLWTRRARPEWLSLPLLF